MQLQAGGEADIQDQLCPLRYAMDVVGGKWRLPILCMLADGQPVRYSTIRRRLAGITNMMLSQSLKDLEAAGMVQRTQYNEVPPRVEYALTDKGQSILPALAQLGAWGAQALRQHSGSAAACARCQVTP